MNDVQIHLRKILKELKMKTYWQGKLPHRDNFDVPIGNEFIDGKTQQGPWAIMTPYSWACMGIGSLGTGRGQRYVKQRDGKWLKVEG